jgi:hypothetical protein
MMSFPKYFILALVPTLAPSIVWFLKMLLVERYTFLYGDKAMTGPYVMVRLDRLTGRVHGFNWAGWVQVKPHSGYPGTETPK